MGLRRLFVTAGAVWAPPLAISVAVAMLAIAIITEQFLRDYVSLENVVTLIAVCALVAFAGSIFLGNRYGKRFARKEPPSWAANFGSLLVVLGIMANVAVMVGFANLPVLDEDEIYFEIYEEMPGESLGK